MNATTYDAVIIGARMAGASLANFLARKGYSVCLIDRASFPSDTLSTHIFGSWNLYRKLGIEDEVRAAGAPDITRVRIDFNGCQLEAPILVTSSVNGLRRTKLDQILLDRLNDFEKVDFLPSCTLIDLLREDDQVVGAVVETAEGVREIRSRVVVGADGRNSKVAQLVQAAEYRTDEPLRCAYYSYFENLTPNPVPTFEFSWTGSDMMLINPCDDNLHIAVVMPLQSEYPLWKSQAQTLYLERLQKNETLAARLTNARLTGPVRGSGTLRSYLRQSYGPGWVLVGDAGAAVHPCAGAGMDQAIISADLLCEALHRVLSGASSWADMMSFYQTTRDGYASQNIEAANAMASLQTPDPRMLDWFRLFATMPSLASSLVQQAPDILSSLAGEAAKAKFAKLFANH